MAIGLRSLWVYSTDTSCSAGEHVPRDYSVLTFFFRMQNVALKLWQGFLIPCCGSGAYWWWLSSLQYMHLLTHWSNISSGGFSLGVPNPNFGVEMVFKAAHMSSETCFKELLVEVHGQTLSIHFLSLLLISFVQTSLSLVMFFGHRAIFF